MNRKSTSEQVDILLDKIRKNIPDVILRTSLIVGFPGETEEDFFELYEFVNKAKFEKLGVFKYSKEDGTPASRLKDQIHYKTKQKRWNIIMKEQEKISKENLECKIGNIYTVLIDDLSYDRKYYIGRSYMDIPDEDSVVYMKNNKSLNVGEFVQCKIIDIRGYDLIGEII
jgi:ribosomal protein S12 methylthiotransferase